MALTSTVTGAPLLTPHGLKQLPPTEVGPGEPLSYRLSAIYGRLQAACGMLAMLQGDDLGPQIDGPEGVLAITNMLAQTVEALYQSVERLQAQIGRL